VNRMQPGADRTTAQIATTSVQISRKVRAVGATPHLSQATLGPVARS